MSANDPQAARTYHETTKHSVESVRRDRHFLDWENQPIPFKVYESLPPIALPRDLPELTVPALEALAGGEAPASRPAALDVRTLALVLHLSAGIIREKVYPNGHRMYFRAAACTGALYHIDLYVACSDIAGLDAGVYHFAPHDFSLRRLRQGDHRSVLVAASGGEDSIAKAPVALVVTSTFWRNAWKYRSRAYRHCYWDAGTILANLLAVAGANRVPARVTMGFVDRTVEQLVGIDGEKEVALALVSLGSGRAPAASGERQVDPISFPTAKLSEHEVGYPAMHEMHVASSLPNPDEVRRWRERPAGRGVVGASDAATNEPEASPTVTLPVAGAARGHGLSRAVLRRGSSRHFSHAAIAVEDLATILATAAAPVPFDLVAPVDGLRDELCSAYLIVNAVDGLEPGTYVYDADRHGLKPLRTGEFRREAGFLGLGQELPADAAANIYYLCALEPLLERFGARGYRLAQMLAAIRGGRVYLAAYALGLGATGLTFFDDEVTRFFSPHAAGKSVMFLMAVGRPRRHVAL